MYGLQAIAVHNGWAMALAGSLIVFSGLVVLSFVISQLHKILNIFKKKQIAQEPKTLDVEPPEEKPWISLPKQFPTDIKEVALLYKPLVEELGETFYLSQLYEMSKKNNFPHPHITLTAFRESNILISDGDGVFSWNPPTENDDNENVEG